MSFSWKKYHQTTMGELLKLTFSIVPCVPRLTRLASPWAERSSTLHHLCDVATASAKNLVPVIFGAKALDQ